MAVRIGMVSLGCPKNQVDAEILLADLKKNGYELTTDSGNADIVIINTCAFIESAKQESIENILEFCDLKKEGKIKGIIITGCLSERYRQQVKKEIPEVDAVIGIGSNDKLIEAVKAVLDGQSFESYGEKENLTLCGDRIIANLPFFAYVKIAEGCDNCCTYCAIPQIRGKFRSRTIENIVKEVQDLADKGITEIILVAQDTTRYGEDLYGKSSLAELLQELCKIEKIHWIRTLYNYPERITDELIDTVAKEEKCVKYFDIPMQHCDGDVLKRMNRLGDKERLKQLISKIRSKIPEVIIRSTFIAGFPGESEEQFEELCEFVKEMQFDRMGCFAYSREEDTPAADFDCQLDDDIKSRRADIINDEQMLIMERKNEALVGITLEVVCEGFDRYAECYFGRSKNDAPDIDPKVFFMSDKKIMTGEYVKVKITQSMDADLIGERI